MTRLVLAFVLLGTCAALAAQAFDPRRYFGDGYTPSDLPHEGTLSLPLTQSKFPPWVSLGGSGNARVNDRFTATDSGTSLGVNDDHRTLQLGFDLAADVLSTQVEIRSLDPKGSVAFLLADYADPARAWLVEVKDTEGQWRLQVRARTRDRFATLPETVSALAEPKLPLTFTLEFRQGNLSAQCGSAKTSTDTKFKGGLTLAVAVTDAPATLRDLRMSFASHEAWRADALERQNAQDTMLRLREYADEGLLSGVGPRPHRLLSQQLETLSAAERAARDEAARKPYAERADALVVLADAHETLAALSHEAGLAALRAGRLEAARKLLERAHKADAAPETALLLVEVLRRLGLIDDAAKRLDDAAVELPEALRPDAALLRARLASARGDLPLALKTLRKAADDHPGHQQIAAFLDSALALTELPEIAVEPESAPLGLRLVGNIRPEVLTRVLHRLKPYTAQIRNWLPETPKQPRGVIALFDTSVDYLRAALLVAGDNLDNVAGMYIPRGVNEQPTVLASRAFGEDELLRTLVHELWHLAVDACGYGRSMPRWLNEGMAVYLSAARVVDERQSSERLVYDTLPSEFMEFADTLAEGLGEETLHGVLQLGVHEFYRPELVRRNYAAAWAYVTACANSDQIGVLVRAVGGDGPKTRELAKLPGMAAAADELLKKLAKAG